MEEFRMAINGANRNGDFYYGDIYELEDEAYNAGDHTITGDAEDDGIEVSGDVAYAYFGAQLDGGDDSIRVSAYAVYGDAYYADEDARVLGGDDAIGMRRNVFDDEYYVTGDVWTLYGFLRGGDDAIIGFLDDVKEGHFVGDASYLDAEATATGGEDEIRATHADDYIYGDFVEVFSSNASGDDDDIWGYDGDDRIYGDAQDVDSELEAYGDDTVRGGRGDDRLYGDDSSRGREEGGADRLFGASGDDSIYGAGGDDILKGAKGRDEIYGGWGEDVIGGGDGRDLLEGEEEDDAIDGGDGNDDVYGGDGEDKLVGGSDGDALYGGDDDDRLNGNRGDDEVHGEDGDDIVKGGRNGDALHGGDGDDHLKGGRGRDDLDGGDGEDVLTGGKQADTFLFRSVEEEEITDFSSRQGDQIDLSEIDEIDGWRDLRDNHLVDLGVREAEIVIASNARVLVHLEDGLSLGEDDFIL
jgi:Ca2+-binding RTX toxin-like protein